MAQDMVYLGNPWGGGGCLPCCCVGRCYSLSSFPMTSVAELEVSEFKEPKGERSFIFVVF